MKKTIAQVLSVLVFIASGSAYAEEKMKEKPAKGFHRPYGVAGCGLGSLIFKKRMQVSAATTNGFYYNQEFGITSGTSNCVDTPKTEMSARVDDFVNVNKSMLLVDMVKGKGENLTALTKMLECQDSDVVSQSLKSNFSTIYNAGQNTTMEITDSIITVLMQNGGVASCKALATLSA